MAAKNKKYNCNFCPEKDMTKDELYRHLKDRHPKEDDTQKGKTTSQTSVKAEVLPSSASSGLDDDFILDNLLKSEDILSKAYDIATIDTHDYVALQIEVMRERFSGRMSAQIELNKLRHMGMIKDEKKGGKI